MFVETYLEIYIYFLTETYMAPPPRRLYGLLRANPEGGAEVSSTKNC